MLKPHNIEQLLLRQYLLQAFAAQQYSASVDDRTTRCNVSILPMTKLLRHTNIPNLLYDSASAVSASAASDAIKNVDPNSSCNN